MASSQSASTEVESTVRKDSSSIRCETDAVVFVWRMYLKICLAEVPDGVGGLLSDLTHPTKSTTHL